jgi:hypothetical protein
LITTVAGLNLHKQGNTIKTYKTPTQQWHINTYISHARQIFNLKYLRHIGSKLPKRT